MPNTYGVPVAFFGVPNGSALAVPAADAVAVEPDEALVPLLGLLGLLELPELQPAAVSAAAAIDATASHL